MPRRSAGARPVATKTCAVCGRPFADRGSWRRRGVWSEVRYCSDACRRRRREARGAEAPHEPPPNPPRP
ncbi:MAG: DUF2256 domain-containing protein [Trueperaceae bacterium]|nr:DUF2256 domain-containing protein [Trueperaceae bacterium]